MTGPELAKSLREAATGRIEVTAAPPLRNVEPMAIGAPGEGTPGTLGSPEAAPNPVTLTEDQVSAAIVALCDTLARMSGDPADRAQPWELAITVPGTTRLLNRWAPWIGRSISQWDPKKAGGRWPDWGGLVLMAAARVAPRMFEGRAIEWVQAYRAGLVTDQTETGGGEA